MYLCLTGETVDAAEAHRIGLVNEVVPLEEVQDRAAALAARLCENSPLVVKMEKELVQRSLEMPRREALRFSWVMHFAQRYGHDALAGLKAFAEKTKPSYRGW
ncbi:enoyl-CoA hydratase-related protein [Nocardioides sp. TF02-7]|uniref:enoyl-CoA hydratase-related protein n=1 Tax=Nocardioides sp. TF02-7 TaxID=2917724 RepID=UPI0023DC0412|nr:enoyl-CoA hydratase-related protein [Nocardioides sp. TF02-7]